LIWAGFIAAAAVGASLVLMEGDAMPCLMEGEYDRFICSQNSNQARTWRRLPPEESIPDGEHRLSFRGFRRSTVVANEDKQWRHIKESSQLFR
jgi:hypothetical protein